MLKPSTCKPCPLYTLGNSFSKPDGKGKSGVIIIGEALGHDEAIDGLPFRPHAVAGSKLEECIKLNGFSREDFLLWNIIACQPPGPNKLVGQWYESRAISCCSQYLKGVIDEFKIPVGANRKVILALGNTAFCNLTGRWDSVLDVRGYPFALKWNEEITVIPSLHPSFIKRGNNQYTPLLVEDIRKAVEIARWNGEWTNKKFEARYEYRPSGGREEIYKDKDGKGVDDSDTPF